jgi:hypothetical protein
MPEKLIISKAFSWLNTQKIKNGQYRFSPLCRQPSLQGTTCTVLAMETLGVLFELDDIERNACSSYINSFQQKDGWFKDPQLMSTHHKQQTHSKEYWLGHSTFLAQMALDALNTAPRYQFQFLDKWRDDAAVHEFIDSLDWTNPWRESNWVEWLGVWLLWDAGLRPPGTIPKNKWPQGFGGLIKWLVDNQDPETGYWGNPPGSQQSKRFAMMAGAYHHYLFFYATGTEIPYVDRIIDNTLSLQEPDGLFGNGKVGGGPCEDMDAIDILANMSRLSDHRRKDVQKSLKKASKAILYNQRNNGAFVWRRQPERKIPFLKRLRIAFAPRSEKPIGYRMSALTGKLVLETKEYTNYYGTSTELMYNVSKGDVFSMWFRPAALAIASTALGRRHAKIWWDFGFRNQFTQNWWPG